MLKIIIPLAGSSKLFENAGYFYPKPLIEVDGIPMIERVITNPKQICAEIEFIFIIREEDAAKFHLHNTLKILVPNSKVVRLNQDTKGGLCSVLMTIDEIAEDDELLILNGDQIIDENLDEIYDYWKKNQADAGLVTFKSVHPRWAYARIEEDQVVQTAEKNPISNHALAGVYYFSKAKVFFNAAFSSIKKDVQLEGMFFISPVINEYVLSVNKVVTYSIESYQYHPFYSPQMLIDYERKLMNNGNS